MSLQNTLAAALLDSGLPSPDGLTAWNGSDPARRFAVYRNNVIVSLVDALADIFAVTQELVGEPFFRAMAREFAYAEPPRSRLMAFYGANFPDFIARFPPAAGVSYLADVARLEYLRVLAYHAGDADPVSLAEIRSTLADVNTLPSLRLTLHPSLNVLSSAYAVVSLWAAHQGVMSLSSVVPETPETGLVLRQGLDVEVMRIPPAAGIFIDALLHGSALGEASELAVRIDVRFDPAEALGMLLQNRMLVALVR